MFGLIYALLMGAGLTVDSARKGIENMNAKDRSIIKNGWSFGYGKSYYNGIEAREKCVNGHRLVVDRRGRLIVDLTEKKENEYNSICEKEFNDSMNKAIQNGEKYFYYPCQCFKCRFQNDHPGGWYEIKTLKRIHKFIIKSSNCQTQYFICYDRYFIPNHDGQKFYNLDFKNRIELTKEEWDQVKIWEEKV